MGKIVISENVSLDGVVQDPTGEAGFKHGGWFEQFMGEDREAWATVEFAEARPRRLAGVGQRRRSKEPGCPRAVGAGIRVLPGSHLWQWPGLHSSLVDGYLEAAEAVTPRQYANERSQRRARNPHSAKPRCLLPGRRGASRSKSQWTRPGGVA